MTAPTFARRHQREAAPWTPLLYMDDYLHNMAVDERVPGYIAMTKIGLNYFGTWAKEQGIGHPNDIQRSHILAFQAYLATLRKDNGELFSVGYRRQILKNVRAWVNWLHDLEYIDNNPWVRIRVGQSQKVPKPLEPEEVELLFAAHTQQAFSINPFHYHRREAILTLLLGWGLRIHELHSLNVRQMDARLQAVRVINKGGGTKEMPYSPELKMAVQRYLRHRASHATHEEDALLVDSRGKRLSIDMIRRIVVECGDRAGIKINPHRLRDTLGTTLFDNGVDMRIIQAMLGHSTMAQTEAYSKVRNPVVSAAHQAVVDPILVNLLRPALPKSRPAGG